MTAKTGENVELIVCIDDTVGFNQTGETCGQYLMRITQNEEGHKTVYIVLQPDN